ncbi:MAG: hypothetical protein KJ674_03285 [Nanoarchaeota archaeon]|nr:hypothetical protein [Nanoarchaeota archaeon]
MKNKIIIIVNLIIIAILFTHFNILLEYPKNNEHLFDRSIELKWGGNYDNYTLYIDDNKDFKSPTIKKVTGNSYLINNLDFNTYYWKIETDKMRSATWKFILDSKVAINMIEKDNKIEIENVGNTDLKLDVINPITGLTIVELPYQESKEFENNISFIGKQK